MTKKDSTKPLMPDKRASRRSRRAVDTLDRAERRGKRGLLRGGSRGQSLAEFALMLPVLMILVFGIIDFSFGLRSYLALTNATREGARFAAVGSAAGSYPSNCNGTTNTTVIGRVCVAAQPLAIGYFSNVSVSYPNGQTPGNRVVVSTAYTYHYITPIGAIINFFTGGAFASTLPLTTSTDMRLE